MSELEKIGQDQSVTASQSMNIEVGFMSQLGFTDGPFPSAFWAVDIFSPYIICQGVHSREWHHDRIKSVNELSYTSREIVKK